MTADGASYGKHAVDLRRPNGIGRATARRFAAEGAAIRLINAEADLLDELVAELTATAVGPVTRAKVDVRDEGRVQAAVDDAERQFGQLDVVIANAAVEPADDASILDLELEVWRRVIETNLTGCFLTAKYGARALARGPNRGRAARSSRHRRPASLGSLQARMPTAPARAAYSD